MKSEFLLTASTVSLNLRGVTEMTESCYKWLKKWNFNESVYKYKISAVL